MNQTAAAGVNPQKDEFTLPHIDSSARTRPLGSFQCTSPCLTLHPRCRVQTVAVRIGALLLFRPAACSISPVCAESNRVELSRVESSRAEP
jgi:hypothetical protein